MELWDVNDHLRIQLTTWKNFFRLNSFVVLFLKCGIEVHVKGCHDWLDKANPLVSGHCALALLIIWMPRQRIIREVGTGEGDGVWNCMLYKAILEGIKEENPLFTIIVQIGVGSRDEYKEIWTLLFRWNFLLNWLVSSASYAFECRAKILKILDDFLSSFFCKLLKDFFSYSWRFEFLKRLKSSWLKRGFQICKANQLSR